MTNSKKVLVRSGIALGAGFLIFVSFQNCSRNGFNALQNGGSDSSTDSYLGSKSSSNSSSSEEMASSAAADVASCVTFPSSAVQIEGSFGQAVNINVPIQSTCPMAVRISRLNLSGNSGNIAILKRNDKQPAFVGTGFDLSASGNDELITSPINSYGNVLVNLNYLVTAGQSSVTKTVAVFIHVSQPGTVKPVPESGYDKMSCVPPGINPATYTEAYQIKQGPGSPNAGQWSACTVYKCAQGYIFQGSACVKFEVPSSCQGQGKYTWGTGATPDCSGQFSGSLAVGQSQVVDNQSPGFKGGKYIKCIMFEQHMNYIDDLSAGPKVMTYMAPSITEDYSQSSCVQTAFKDCEPDVLTEQTYNGVPYNFTISAMKHQETKTITGYSTSANPSSTQMTFRCWDGKTSLVK